MHLLSYQKSGKWVARRWSFKKSPANISRTQNFVKVIFRILKVICNSGLVTRVMACDIGIVACYVKSHGAVAGEGTVSVLAVPAATIGHDGGARVAFIDIFTRAIHSPNFVYSLFLKKNFWVNFGKKF